MITFLLAAWPTLVIGLATVPTVMLTTNVELLNDIVFTAELADSTSDEFIMLEQLNKHYLYLPMIGVLEEENMSLKVFNMKFSNDTIELTCVINGTETETGLDKTKAVIRLEYYRNLTESENNIGVENLAKQLEDKLNTKIENKVEDVVGDQWIDEPELYWLNCGPHSYSSRSINTVSNLIGIDSVDKENSDCKTRVNMLQYILSYILILKVLQM